MISKMSTLLSIRINDHLSAQLSKLASEKHQTKTEVIREALEAYFKYKEAKLKTQMKILHKIDKDDDYIGDDL